MSWGFTVPENWLEIWQKRELLTCKTSLTAVQAWVNKHQYEYSSPLHIGEHPKDGFVVYTETEADSGFLKCPHPSCNGKAHSVGGGHVEAGEWDGRNYEVEVDLTRYECDECGRSFYC